MTYCRVELAGLLVDLADQHAGLGLSGHFLIMSTPRTGAFKSMYRRWLVSPFVRPGLCPVRGRGGIIILPPLAFHPTVALMAYLRAPKRSSCIREALHHGGWPLEGFSVMTPSWPQATTFSKAHRRRMSDRSFEHAGNVVRGILQRLPTRERSVGLSWTVRALRFATLANPALLPPKLVVPTSGGDLAENVLGTPKSYLHSRRQMSAQEAPQNNRSRLKSGRPHQTC